MRRRAAALAVACCLTPAVALGTTRPFADGAVEARSPPLRPELLVARERYDPGSRRQAIYLRVLEDSPVGTSHPPELAHGRLSVSGARIVEVLWRGADLEATDPGGSAPFTYGIPGAPYDSPGRGLEGGDPFTQVPAPPSEADALRLAADGSSLDFFFSTSATVDDIRVVLQYPDPPRAASFSLRLYGASECAAICGNQGWPPGNVRGFVVGQIEPSVVPDDGVYAETIEISGISLTVLDLDVVEADLDLGPALAGTRTAALPIHVDNFAGGVDLAGDNGFDLNGPFGRVPGFPFPANVDLVAVKVLPSDLLGPGAPIPAAAVSSSPQASAMPVGERRPITIQVAVPAGQAWGVYTGALRVFEDDNGDGLNDDTTEATLGLRLEVVPFLDAGIPDGGPPDAGLSDGGSDDGGADAGLPDGGARPDAGGPDAGAADGAPEASHLRGGACSCASAAGGGGLWMFLLLACALWRLGRSSRGALLFVLLLPTVADAQTLSPDMQLFRPNTPEAGYLAGDGAFILAPGDISAGLVLGYARDPLVRYARGHQTGLLLSELYTADLSAAVGVWGPIQVGLGFPLVLPRGRSTERAVLSSAAAGDVRLVPKVRLFSAGRWRLAFVPEVVLPTGDSRNFAGEGGVAFAPRLNLELLAGPLRAAFNLGYRFRSAVRLENLLYDDEISYRAALSWRAHPRLEVMGELSGATSAVKPFRNEVENPLEALAGLRIAVASGISILAGGGAGILPGYGSPAARFFLGVGHVPPEPVAAAEPPRLRDRDGDRRPRPPPDRDGDGVPDDLDLCPDEPGPAKDSGCPDSDGDGIPDHLDRCPYEREDPDGFADEDGCPDPDNDFDGIPDGEDPDPLEPQPPPGVRRVEPPPEIEKTARVSKERMLILEKVHFRPGATEIAPESLAVLARVATVVRAHDIIKLRVDGHVETQRGWSRGALVRLSEQVAEEVRNGLVKRGVDPERLAVFGFGDKRPLAPRESPRAAQVNRRVEFVVVEQ
jgi:outer membrane protein OmpA-like peptidoglycan-associated protein